MSPNLKLVVFRLDGNLDQRGFTVEVEVGMADQPLMPLFRGHLPPMPRLAQQFQQWRQDYQRWGFPTRIQIKEISFTGSAQGTARCRKAAQSFSHCFSQWLQSPDFLKIDIRLRELIAPDDATVVLLKTESETLHKLPWHLWDFIDRYSQTEVVLSATNFGDTPLNSNSSNNSNIRKDTSPVRILAILGNATGINIDTDRELLQRLPNAAVTFLCEPERHDVNTQLWEQTWDILFFAGHSQTERDSSRIYINQNDSLTLDELKYGLRKSIQKGLKLAIFNSCEGLGLAYELEHLSLPHLIVMREPVPDKVAHAFLTHFLKSFSKGQSLYQSVREARERLQGLENDFPCASWLPIIYQQPQAHPFQWPSGEINNSERGDAKQDSQSKLSLGLMIASSVLTGGLVFGLRLLGGLQPLELQAFDHFMGLQPNHSDLKNRILVIGVDEADIQYQDRQSMDRRDSLSEAALEIVFQKLMSYQPQVIGLDIIHDYPFSPESIHYLAGEEFVAICQTYGQKNQISGTAPPSNISEKSIGFNNIPLDPDGVIRRQFLGKPPDEVCSATESFSFKVAQRYLQKEANIKIEWIVNMDNGRNQIQLGKQVFKPLDSNSGGYQLSEGEANGYQILVNYHQGEPDIIYLRDILSGTIDTQLENLTANKIVLIGVLDERDRHSTPDSKALESVPGVIIHAHMINQVIDAALGKQPVLSWWPEWLEFLWIFCWALLGTGVVILRRSSYQSALAILAGTIILWCVCFFFFIQGWWIPLVPPFLGFALSGVCLTGLNRYLNTRKM
ncbi:MAG: CHASE2 domain-containing protein [Cyanobacteria bacterium P01_F01_bin.150]